MKDLELKIKKLDLKQNAIKILINSIYGAFGNKYFYFFNTDISESITLQGQDQIQFMKKATDVYFTDKWHLDTELHEKLGLSGYTIEKIPDNVPATIYIDTDSNYVDFGPMLKSIKGYNASNDEQVKLCAKMYDLKLEDYFKEALTLYGKLFNSDNLQNFQLENISDRGIWLAKKHYAIKVVYKPNKEQKLLTEVGKKPNLIVKGLEQIQAAYPIFARKKLEVLTNIILEKGHDLDVEKDIVSLLEQYKKEALSKDPDELAFSFRVRKYDEYVVDEKQYLYRKGLPIYGRAAAYYNGLLLNENLLGKYPKLREGEKIKMYTCKEGLQFDIFAYPPGKYPIEIAPAMDYDIQFYRIMVEPINRQLLAMGFGELDDRFYRKIDYIKPKTRKAFPESSLYPLYVINTETLDYEEVPEKFNKILGPEKTDTLNPKDLKEYLQIISKYGKLTKVIPNIELQNYRKRISKKLNISVDLNPEQFKLNFS